MSTIPFGYFTSPEDWLIVGLITVFLWGFPLWALIDCAVRPFYQSKALWIVAILFTGPIGSILYLTIGRNKKPMP